MMDKYFKVSIFFFSLKATFSSFNSLPNDNFLDWSKLKAFADDKIDVT